jgi:Dolichyl-phosphate-mannose-protein mannosyltransferase
MLLGGVFAALALAAAVWVAIDRRPPEWDHANHLERAVLCARDLRAGAIGPILDRSSFYPPLALCLTGAVSLWLHVEAAAVAVMLGFLALGVASVYGLGRALAGESTGLLAALGFATAPFVVYSSLRLQLDLPLAAMVALALVVLLATEHLTRRGPALAFGVVCGLGLLTKPTFLLYVAPAVLLVVARGRWRALSGIVLATAVAAALSLPWYGPRVFGLGAQVEARSFAQAAEAGHPDPLTLEGLTFYPRWLGYQLGLGAAMLAAVGVVACVVRRQWFLVIAVGIPFVGLAMSQNKNLRYSLPLLGALAVLAALGLQTLPARVRRPATVAAALLAIVQVSGVVGGVPQNRRIPGLQASWLPSSPPRRADWAHQPILALLERDRRGAPATVSVVPNDSAFAVSNFRYYAVRDGLGLRFVRAWDDPPLGIDYMILKSGDQGPSWTAEKSRRVAERLDRDPYLARVFPVIGEFPLPDGSTATVRARRVLPSSGATPAQVAAAVEAGLRRRLGEVARDVERLQIRLVHDEAILGGRLQRVEIHAAGATLGEFTRPGTSTLRVRDVGVVLEDLLVNPWSALAESRFDPLDAGRLRLETVTVPVPDLQAYVAGLKKFRRSTVASDGDALAITLRPAGPDISARVRMLPAADRPFMLAAEHVRVGGVPVPDALVNWVIRNFDPAPRIAARMPFPVEIGRVTVRDEALRISRDR